MSVGRVVEVATGDTVLYKSGERAALQFHKLYLHTGPPQGLLAYERWTYFVV
jgi:hypothetical protein